MGLTQSEPIAPDSKQILINHLEKQYKLLPSSRRDQPGAVNIAIEEGIWGYVASLKQVLDGELLKGAKKTSFHYLVLQNEKPAQVAELIRDLHNGSRVVALHGADKAEGLHRGLRALKKLKQLISSDYELRVIEAPAIHFLALWLHRSDADWLVPIKPGMGPLKANNPYSEKAVLAALLAPARKAEQMCVPENGPIGG